MSVPCHSSNPCGLGFQPENPTSQPAAQATREQQVTMLAVRRKPPGEEPEGSRPSATSLVVHVVPSKASQHRRSGPLLVNVVPVTTRRVSKAAPTTRHMCQDPVTTRSVSKAVSPNPPRKRRVNNKSRC
ncbi:hypothetical protein RB1179 [Rhodopirellula baltica SH 1]|uniref:Uncharacterized protein n=1 Tax=Rhodopirellula baltica (strain DSM 10527 / NCIMB 13988 / SH1) TaxID=243090 RepID=Q7UXQ9_RHOBA|nr:hypothetical protein RB1179 [Rhodopirellula baltica SH 1]